ncbi:uncharacterized protein LOC101855311 [Aplysia californica]|uniref:Uncharacterized protein LOC101855311 n=1 Tax=Aplysia californica TaxID=6500 RepID=A0ABM0KA77_APLCA|nr:uncharacterized protein LOC101855311 [Aplysia californica]XP_005112655.1 uncharacterized protein LOC101855311 [Aplysia californica]
MLKWTKYGRNRDEEKRVDRIYENSQQQLDRKQVSFSEDSIAADTDSGCWVDRQGEGHVSSATCTGSPSFDVIDYTCTSVADISKGESEGKLPPLPRSDFPSAHQSTSSSLKHSLSSPVPIIVVQDCSGDSLTNSRILSKSSCEILGLQTAALPKQPVIPLLPSDSKMASELPDVTSSSVSNSNPEEEIIGPELPWENERLSVRELADKDVLPCVASFFPDHSGPDSEGQGLSPGLRLYARQPVLLHERAKSRQAKARTIYRDKGGAYYEVGQTLIIPDSYKGWFEIVPSDFSRSTCFQTIEEVAKTMPSRFFSRSHITAIRIEGEGDSQKYLERRVRAGSVLETKGLFTAKWKTQAVTGMLRKKTTEWLLQEVTYLKCLDKEEVEILVPLSHRGKFNAIYKRGQISQNAVYSMKDVLSDLTLPVKVRLLYGKAPVVPCIFTGMMILRDAKIGESVVGSTILNSRNVLFELPLGAPIKIRLATNDEALQEMTSYKDGQKLCRKYAHMYGSMIKLSPDLDTNQKTIMHVPTDPSLLEQADEALRALDLITDISLTGEPEDHLLDSASDSASTGSAEPSVVPKGGTLAELSEYRSRESQTHV